MTERPPALTAQLNVAEAVANVLTGGNRPDPLAKIPEPKAYAVRIEKPAKA